MKKAGMARQDVWGPFIRDQRRLGHDGTEESLYWAAGRAVADSPR